MNKNRLFSNAYMSILQVLVTSSTLFFIYKVLLKSIGVKQLGVWSLVMATGTLTQLANMGLAGGVTKFVAMYVAREDHDSASRVVQTAAVSLAFSTGTVLAIIYLLAKPILSMVIPLDSIQDALAILPYSLISVWLMVQASVFQAGLDGYQRIDSRNIIVMTGSILYLGLCTFFAFTWGLIGVAFANVLQNLWLLAVTSHSLRKRMPTLPVFKYIWDGHLFKEMLGYGARIQLMSVTIMATDPVTKALLGSFGGLSAVGYYEMASRLVQQIRLVIATPVFSLVPAIAELKENSSERITGLYLNSYHLVFSSSLTAFALVIMYAPVISELWIGRYEPLFVVFTIMLTVGYWINLLSVPSYFSNLGKGELFWNLAGHISMAVINVLCGYILGRYFGALGVVFGWASALALGGIITAAGYHSNNHIDLSVLLPKANILMIVVTIICVGATYGILPQVAGSGNKTAIIFVVYFLLTLLLLVSLWVHPSRKQVYNLVARK